jgi:hypothetical protein
MVSMFATFGYRLFSVVPKALLCWIRSTNAPIKWAGFYSYQSNHSGFLCRYFPTTLLFAAGLPYHLYGTLLCRLETESANSVVDNTLGFKHLHPEAYCHISRNRKRPVSAPPCSLPLPSDRSRFQGSRSLVLVTVLSVICSSTGGK